MLKSNPDHRPPAKPPAGKQPMRKPLAAPTGDAVPGIFTGPFATAKAVEKLDQRESATRRAHRLRMKEFFARANSIS